MGFLLKLLLFVNIVITAYLIFLISDFHKDVQSIKHSVQKSSEFVKDTWDVVGGLVIDKASVIKKHSSNVKDWVVDNYNKIRNNKENEL